MLEALICGETQMPAFDLHRTVVRLIQKDEANERKTGFEQQFEVKYLTCLPAIVMVNEGLHTYGDIGYKD